STTSLRTSTPPASRIRTWSSEPRENSACPVSCSGSPRTPSSGSARRTGRSSGASTSCGPCATTPPGTAASVLSTRVPRARGTRKRRRTRRPGAVVARAIRRSVVDLGAVARLGGRGAGVVDVVVAVVVRVDVGPAQDAQAERAGQVGEHGGVVQRDLDAQDVHRDLVVAEVDRNCDVVAGDVDQALVRAVDAVDVLDLGLAAV